MIPGFFPLPKLRPIGKNRFDSNSRNHRIHDDDNDEEKKDEKNSKDKKEKKDEQDEQAEKDEKDKKDEKLRHHRSLEIQGQGHRCLKGDLNNRQRKTEEIGDRNTIGEINEINLQKEIPILRDESDDDRLERNETTITDSSQPLQAEVRETKLSVRR